MIDEINMALELCGVMIIQTEALWAWEGVSPARSPQHSGRADLNFHTAAASVTLVCGFVELHPRARAAGTCVEESISGAASAALEQERKIQKHPNATCSCEMMGKKRTTARF